MAMRTKQTYRMVLLLTSLVLISGALSCGGKDSSSSGESTGAVDVSLRWVPPPYYANRADSLATEPGINKPRAPAYPDNVCSEWGIEWVVLTVEYPDGLQKVARIHCDVGRGEISGIPVGSNYKLIVEAFGVGDGDDWSGMQGGINVEPGSTTWIKKMPIYWIGNRRPPGIDMAGSYPGQNAVDVPTNSPVSVKFDKCIVGATVNGNSFKLSGPGGSVVGALTYDARNKIATFTPNAPLQSDTTYTLSLENTIMDFADLSLSKMSWSFTTAGGLDNTPPTVVETNPANNADNVSVNATVTVRFSENMNATSVPGGITMTDNTGVSVPGQVAYYSIDTSASFDPLATLLNLSYYSLKISTAVKDLAGNSLPADCVVVFRTGAATLVGIAVSPSNPSIAYGSTQQFTATGTYSDGTTPNVTSSATWSSSNTAVATISNAGGSSGKATAVAGGNCTITASLDGKTVSTTLTVYPEIVTLVSIAVTPSNPSIANGTTQQFTATGTYSNSTTQVLTTSVTWSSSNTAVATISNTSGTNGKATAAAVGSSTITATSGSVSGTATLTVTPPPAGVWGSAIWGSSIWGP